MAFPFRYKTSTHTFQLNLSVKKLDKSDLRFYVPLGAKPLHFWNEFRDAQEGILK